LSVCLRLSTEQAALYHVFSKMQHSCEPNCQRHVHPRTNRIEVIALRDIEPGELLTIDYTGWLSSGVQSVLDRRALLLDGRGFECICSRCERESKVAKELAVYVGPTIASSLLRCCTLPDTLPLCSK
jgi:hypothetical protein